VPFEEKIEPGEWFYTSGDDRIFPRGFPVGVVKAVRSAQPFKEILVDPIGMARGLEDVLILIEGVHQAIPDAPPTNQPVFIAPPPADTVQPPDKPGTSVGTEADRLRAQYKAIGDAQGHKFGEGQPGSKPPDFNFKPPGPAGAPAGSGTGAGTQAPGPPPASKPAAPPGGASH
jgi:rod shape-determining protein MreC